MQYRIVTLCGSTKFKDTFMRVAKDLTLKGNIVLMPNVFGHAGDNEALSDFTKAMLDDMHKKKIELSDEVFVINEDGYIGHSTAKEIVYAIKLNKPITFMEE